MRIGYEAKRVYSNSTGLGNASRALVHSMASFFPANDYVLFTPELTTKFDANRYSNIEVIAPSSGTSTLRSNLWRSLASMQGIKKHQLDIYHGLSAELPIGIQHLRCKKIVHVYDIIFEHYPKQYNTIDILTYRWKTKYACRHADAITVISEQTKNDLVNCYNIDPQKIHVVYLSCDEIFAKRYNNSHIEKIKQQYNLPQRYYLNVGSIIERKQLLQLCQAMRLLPEHLQLPLVVIGSSKDAYAQQVKNYVVQEKLEEKIIFLNDSINAQQHSQLTQHLPSVYQGAAAMIYPSICEGFGMPVLEAMHSGIPVITSNASCLPEVGGEAALYCIPSQPSTIAEAIAQSQAENMMTQKLQHYSTQIAKFEAQQVAERLMNIYSNLLNS